MMCRKHRTQLTDMVQKEGDKIHQLIQFHATKVKCNANPNKNLIFM